LVLKLKNVNSSRIIIEGSILQVNSIFASIFVWYHMSQNLTSFIQNSHFDNYSFNFFYYNTPSTSLMYWNKLFVIVIILINLFLLFSYPLLTMNWLSVCYHFCTLQVWIANTIFIFGFWEICYLIQFLSCRNGVSTQTKQQMSLLETFPDDTKTLEKKEHFTYGWIAFEIQHMCQQCLWGSSAFYKFFCLCYIISPVTVHIMGIL